MIMDDSQNEEYFESSFNFSSQNSDCNIDSLLKPPSDTELELDLKDQEIKISLEKQVNFAREEHDKVVSKNFSKPSVIRPFPPGLHVFTDDTPLIFTLEDLSLEVHFHWTGRERLVKTGQDEDHIERLLCSTEENLIHFVRYLTPELIDNNMITIPEEYVSIVDYLFYCASVCQDDLVFSVLKKCLLDLLKSYSYEWTLTPRHLVTVFLNLGGDPTLMCNPDFYRSIEDLAIYPEEQTFLDSMKIPSSRSEPSMVLSLSRRNHHLCRILEICQNVLRVPGRMESYRGVDKKNWKTLIFLCSLVAQDRHCAPDPRIQRAAATLLHCLLDLVGSRTADILDVVEMVTNRWRPVQVAAAAASWSPGEVPAEMTELGHNHPHNMLALATLFPPAARHLQQLLAFVYIQMILSCREVDLPDPGAVGARDVVGLVERHAPQWAGLCEEQTYTMWCLLKLLDVCIDIRVSATPVNSGELQERNDEEFVMIRRLIDVIERHNIAKFKDTKSSRNVDLVLMIELAKEIITKWRMVMCKAENIRKLKSELKNSQQ